MQSLGHKKYRAKNTLLEGLSLENCVTIIGNANPNWNSAKTPTCGILETLGSAKQE